MMTKVKKGQIWYSNCKDDFTKIAILDVGTIDDEVWVEIEDGWGRLSMDIKHLLLFYKLKD